MKEKEEINFNEMEKDINIPMVNININQYVSNFRIILFTILFLALSVIIFFNVPYEKQYVFYYVGLLVGIYGVFKIIQYKTTVVSKTIQVPLDLLKPMKRLSMYYINGLILLIAIYHFFDNYSKGKNPYLIENVSIFVLICIIVLVTFKIILKLLESTLIKKYIMEFNQKNNTVKEMEALKFRNNATTNIPKDRKISKKKINNNIKQQKSTKNIRGKIK